MTNRGGNQQRWSLTVAWLLLLGCPVYLLGVVTLPNPYDYSQSVGVAALLWCVACLYLVYRGIRRMMRGEASPASSAGDVGPGCRGEDAAAWLVGRPLSSPSRADIAKTLPEYAKRLISGPDQTRP